MSPIYATSDDWDADLYGSVPSNATRLLAAASNLVTEACQCDGYHVDDTGKPTDATLLAAMKAATLTQAAAWVTLGVDPLAGGVTVAATKLSKSLDGASVTFADAAAAAARAAATSQLVPAALRVLKLAQLATTQPWMIG